MHIHMFFTIRDAGRAEVMRKIGTAEIAACQGNPSACHFGHALHRFCIPVTWCSQASCVTLLVQRCAFLHCRKSKAEQGQWDAEIQLKLVQSD